VAFLSTAGVPFLIELGVSLDIFLGVMMLMVLTRRLKVEFGDVDSTSSRSCGTSAGLLVLVAPLLGGAVVAAAPRRGGLRWAAVATNGATLALGVTLAVRVLAHGPVTGAGGSCGPTH